MAIVQIEKSHSQELRNIDCRELVHGHMLELIESICNHGWTEAEVALALADAAEDHVMFLANLDLGVEH